MYVIPLPPPPDIRTMYTMRRRAKQETQQHFLTYLEHLVNQCVVVRFPQNGLEVVAGDEARRVHVQPLERVLEALFLVDRSNQNTPEKRNRQTDRHHRQTAGKYTRNQIRSAGPPSSGGGDQSRRGGGDAQITVSCLLQLALLSVHLEPEALKFLRQVCICYCCCCICL